MKEKKDKYQPAKPTSNTNAVKLNNFIIIECGE